MFMREISRIADRCTLCGQGVVFVVATFDLDEQGAERWTETLERVPHSLFECCRMQALNHEEWPLWV